MSYYVNLEMNYTTYMRLCDAVEEAARHAEDFHEIYELVHLFDFLEDEYERDAGKQNKELRNWMKRQELFKNKEIYHGEYFHRLESVFDEYEEDELLEWKISEENKFHLICELIDVFKKEESEDNNPI